MESLVGVYMKDCLGWQSDRERRAGYAREGTATGESIEPRG